MKAASVMRRLFVFKDILLGSHFSGLYQILVCKIGFTLFELAKFFLPRSFVQGWFDMRARKTEYYFGMGYIRI